MTAVEMEKVLAEEPETAIAEKQYGKVGPFKVTPLNARRWQNFKANRRGYWSLWIFLFLFIFSLLAEFIANDRPILISYKGELLSPIFVDYPEETMLSGARCGR